jgi:hypothetical protein
MNGESQDEKGLHMKGNDLSKYCEYALKQGATGVKQSLATTFVSCWWIKRKHGTLNR